MSRWCQGNCGNACKVSWISSQAEIGKKDAASSRGKIAGETLNNSLPATANMRYYVIRYRVNRYLPHSVNLRAQHIDRCS